MRRGVVSLNLWVNQYHLSARRKYATANGLELWTNRRYVSGSENFMSLRVYETPFSIVLRANVFDEKRRGEQARQTSRPSGVYFALWTDVPLQLYHMNQSALVTQLLTSYSEI